MNAAKLNQKMVPSRHSNPFATCWTRPGALAFRFAEGLSVDDLVARLANQNWRGQIIGPHGSGKTTLLAALRPVLIVAERPIRVIDGYKQLGWLARHRISQGCLKSGSGLLVTSHRSVGLPTLIELRPDRQLVEQLVNELCAATLTPVTITDADASHARYGSNVREILFDLYDRHERLTRAARTAQMAAT
jgi:hypothetical protein